MDNTIKRIGVLTSGGDAPGMNAAVRAVVRTALGRGIEVIGIRRGWHGLVFGDFFQMESKDVSHILNAGGTMLYTARCPEFTTEEGQQNALYAPRLWIPVPGHSGNQRHADHGKRNTYRFFHGYPFPEKPWREKYDDRRLHIIAQGRNQIGRAHV